VVWELSGNVTELPDGRWFPQTTLLVTSIDEATKFSRGHLI